MFMLYDVSNGCTDSLKYNSMLSQVWSYLSSKPTNSFAEKNLLRQVNNREDEAVYLAMR